MPSTEAPSLASAVQAPGSVSTTDPEGGPDVDRALTGAPTSAPTFLVEVNDFVIIVFGTAVILW